QDTSIAALAAVWDEIRAIEPIRSLDHAQLALLGRTDLAITLSKVRLWEMTDLRRVLYLDADTLVVQSLDGLFGLLHLCGQDDGDIVCQCSPACECDCPAAARTDAEADCCGTIFAAAPDAGWPDCFNSGVMLLSPSRQVASRLLALCSGPGASF